jgi:hypothetical protein
MIYDFHAMVWLQILTILLLGIILLQREEVVSVALILLIMH